ncbi:metallophosphoesterase [Luteococcus peritonei]|uniref:Metallophosphoesterase n=1 Tax=Luteococcus peritonei TaxID=88874 RepID=A0ABW4RWU0_9ACTN
MIHPTAVRLLALPVAAGVLASVTSLTAPVARAATPCEAMSSTLYQGLQETSHNSLLTAWPKEYDGLAAHHYVGQGTVGRVATRPASGLVAVHRLWRTAQFRTAAESEVAALVAQGWRDHGVSFHAAPAAAGCGTAMHRVVKDGVTREATDDELDLLVAAGWADQGVGYRVAPAQGGSPAAQPAADPAPLPADPGLAPQDADGRFSLAVIPDTQNETTSATGLQRMVARNQQILAQRASRDTRVALQVGDIVNWDTAEHDQYQRAEQGMAVLERAGLPWVGTIGNHDAQATGPGGSARPGVDTRAALRETSVYNRYFDASSFVLRRGTESPGVEDNSFHTFRAAGADFLVLTLELWPREDKLAWAEQVVAQHPQHNVILLTHNYLAGDGRVASDNGGYGDLPVSAVRQRLVAPHPNVKLVLCGHVGVDRALVEDFPGHRVVALQNNYDNLTDALLRMVEVDVAGGSLVHEYASATTTRVVSPPTTVTGMDWIR